MSLEVFAIMDAKMNCFVRWFVDQNRATAMRAFSELCRDQNSMFYRHHEDYSLWHVGQVDQITSKLKDEANDQIATASQYVALDED